MSGLRVFLLSCDNPDCETTTDEYTNSKRDSQHFARLKGWHTTRRVDYCPEHLPEPLPDLGITFEEKS